MFQPSKYQQSIFDWITTSTGNAVVSAVAGSGKTTTLVQASSLINSNDVLFLSFNKHIAEELSTKLPGVNCKTIHSIGRSAIVRKLGKVKVNNYKYHDIVDSVIQSMYGSKPRRNADDKLNDLKKQTLDILDKGRFWLVDFSDYTALDELCDHFGLLVQADEYLIASKSIELGWKEFDKSGMIDFADMIYYPAIKGWTDSRYDWVLVDESQDLSPCQLKVAMLTVKSDGRMLFVGDKFQSIMGFAGADSNSIDNITDSTNAIELPLSICYRCPTSHIKLAQGIVPHIEARDNAPEGEIEYIRPEQVSSNVSSGDLIVCRTTSPLITLVFQLIANKIPARVRGRDIAKSLTGTIDNISKMYGYHYDNFLIYLGMWQRDQTDKLGRKKHSEASIQRINDISSCLEAAYLGSDSDTTIGLKGQIDSIFSDESASVWLSTVHRAKGLEADNVFILHPEKMPLVWKDQMDWEFEQEMNIKYVALTRAKKRLVFVSDKMVENETVESEW